jgi:hypothetical protein
LSHPYDRLNNNRKGKVMELVTATTYELFATYQIEAEATYSMKVNIEELNEYLAANKLDINGQADKIQIYEHFLKECGYEECEDSQDLRRTIAEVEVYR